MHYSKDYKIYPLGECGLTLEFGRTISQDQNSLALSVSRLLEQDPFEGMIECVPAYSSVSVFYDPNRVKTRIEGETSLFSYVADLIAQSISELPNKAQFTGIQHQIPAVFSKESGLDLESAAKRCGLSIDKFIEIFVSKTYRVYMLGFLPGFPYLGLTSSTIELPRLETPRMKVPAGSIGIAGRQTGVYPFESPGGWQIIGRTETQMFTGKESGPTLMNPGDTVKFVRS